MHIVLVHGAGGSASTWFLLTRLLEADGLSYSLADNPSQSLAADIASVTALIDAVDDEVLLVGHSYGGAVITNAGTHERVRGLVYIAAFAPEEGESINFIADSYPPAEISSFMVRGPNGEWMMDPTKDARQALAWDVPDEVWERRAEDHRVSANAIFSETTGRPAWKTLPAWYLLATSDKHLPPAAQRAMADRAGATIEEINTSHAVHQAAPDRVLAIISRALGELAA
jgi:pimeloyl-ACP methyl ester carboxylesterase